MNLPFLVLRVFIFFLVKEISDASKIVDIDFNSQVFYEHKTYPFYDGFDKIRDVIIRRGAVASFKVELNAPYNGEVVDLILSFSTLKDVLTITLPSDKQGGFRIQETSGSNSLNVRVYIPGNAPVGVWRLSLLLRDRTGKAIQKLNVPNRVIILFNPWSSVDPVYMEDDQKIKEYVMNEKGVIFKRLSLASSGSQWLFNQFKEGVLDAILYVLDKGGLTSVQRGDPVLLVKELKTLINDNGRTRGVLKGQWRGPYDFYEGRPATRPTDWIGSSSILLQYYRTRGVPVAYGQCWVYAGVMTTILRALGVPARVITTFSSGIDYDTDLTIDRYYTADGFLDGYRSDSYWNFHVWNQVWMSRKNDLGSKYGMWQELDGTPQTIRNRVMQNGPAPTIAVKQAQIDKYYDSDVIYSEVNADLIIWRNNQIDLIKTNAIGRAVFTKAVGNNGIEDITWMYKPNEGTQAERNSYRRAAYVKKIRPVSIYRFRARSKQVSVRLVVNKELEIGSPFKVVVYVSNPSSKRQNVSVALKITSLYYNGQDGNILVDKKMTNIIMMAHKHKKIEFSLNAENYIDKLKEFYSSRVEAVAMTADKNWDHDEKTIQFITPSLTIISPKRAKVNTVFFVKAAFTNPLNRSLEKCYIVFEGQRIERKVVDLKDVAAREKVTVEVKIKTKYPRNETILFSFVSKTLRNIHGSANIEIVGKRVNPWSSTNGTTAGIKIPVLPVAFTPNVRSQKGPIMQQFSSI